MDDTVAKCLQILGLPDNASIDEVEEAYKRLKRDMEEGSVPWDRLKEAMWAHDYLVNRMQQTTGQEDSNQGRSASPSRTRTEGTAVGPKARTRDIAPSANYGKSEEPRKNRTKIWVFASIMVLLLAGSAIYFARSSALNNKGTDTASIIKQIKAGIVTISIHNNARGSGFVVSKDGYIVTNAHVMQEKEGIATFSDSSKSEVRLVMLDEERDFALLKATTTKDYAFVKIGDSNKCSEGDAVIAAGSPLIFESSFTKGIISSTKRSFPFLQARLIQTDAAINPGNSGGPLINHSGEVIGINSLKLSGGKVEGIGFAVAINDVKHHIAAKQAMNDGELTLALNRAEKKIQEVSRWRSEEVTKEEKKAMDRIIEEQWERERRRRELSDKIEEAKKDLQEKKETAEKRLQEEYEKQKRRAQENAEMRRKALTECLQNANQNYRSTWDQECEKQNKQQNCPLPYNFANIFEQRLGQARNECYRVYQ